METARGTLEQLALLLARLLQPLEHRLQAGQVRLLLAELGLVLPASFNFKPALTSQLNKAVIGAATLPDKIEALTNAIDKERVLDAINNGQEIIQIARTIFDAINDFANELKNIQPADLNGNAALAADARVFAERLPKRLFDFLVVSNLEATPGMAEALEFIGAIQRTEKTALADNPSEPLSYIEKTFDFSDLFDAITKPTQQMEKLYGWGQNNFGEVAPGRRDMLKVLEKLVTNTGVPAIFDTAPANPTLDILGMELQLAKDLNPRGLRLGLNTEINIDPTYTLSEPPWEISLGLDIPLPLNMQMTIQPNGKVGFVPPDLSVIAGELFFRYRSRAAGPGQSLVLIGQAQGSRLDVQELGFDLRNKLSWHPTENRGDGDLIFSGYAQKLRLLISLGGADSFISSNIPQSGFAVEFDLLLGYSTQTGFFFRGSGALELFIPVHLTLGPIEIRQLQIRLDIGDRLILTLGTSIKFQLGPFTALAENIGARATMTFPDKGGNLGPVNLAIGFKPPNGIGLRVDAGIVKGGGYLFIDTEKGEYAGVAELVIKEMVAVKAIAIINTKLPDGRAGFAFLLLITAEFAPIQLGFGFTLNGVGGLIAINRGMYINALAEGVRTNAIKSIMFPDDPVANAPQIIANLNAFFPIEEGRYTFGLMGIIGWGTPTLIRVELGLMIQVPDPVVLAIIGVIKVALPTEQVATIKIQVNFLGVIDFNGRYMFFFASLFDSKILTFTLTGEMYFSIDWGDNPNFVFSVGGFHPDYAPPPLRGGIGSLRRIQMNLLGGDNPRLTLSFYFAVTANTVQFGASVDFLFKVWKVRVVGYLYFDALFQFNPFYFRIDIGAGLAVMWGSKELFGIHLKGSLEGPTPWRIQGKASFRVLFVKVKVRIDKTFGKRDNTVLPPIELRPLLLSELSNEKNWRAELPADSSLLVSLRQLEQDTDAERLVAHPYGTLAVSQSKIPLNLRMDKFGTDRPADFRAFRVMLEGTTNPGVINEFFAPAQYLNLSDDQKLSRKSFEPFQAGVRALGSDTFSSHDYVSKRYEYEICIVDTELEQALAMKQYSEDADYLARWAEGGAVGRSAMGREAGAEALVDDRKRVKIREEDFFIVRSKDMRPLRKGVDLIRFTTETEARSVLRDMTLKKPELKGKITVLAESELR